ncbi:MAG: DUF503 domain-containing protein [Nitrospinaceae bacterium]
MNVGCCFLRFYLHGNHSLKGKRRVLKSMKDRIRNKFNISIAEIGDLDAWQNIHLGVAAVGSDPNYLNGLMQQVVDFLDNLHLAEMTDCHIEMIHVGTKHL